MYSQIIQKAQIPMTAGMPTQVSLLLLRTSGFKLITSLNRWRYSNPTSALIFPPVVMHQLNILLIHKHFLLHNGLVVQGLSINYTPTEYFKSIAYLGQWHLSPLHNIFYFKWEDIFQIDLIQAVQNFIILYWMGHQTSESTMTASNNLYEKVFL